MVDLRDICEDCPDNDVPKAAVGLGVIVGSASPSDVVGSEVVGVGVGVGVGVDVGRRGSHPIAGTASSSLIFTLGVVDRLCVELEGASVAVETESEEPGITFEVEAEIELDGGLEGPATGSTGSKNPANGADDAGSGGFGMRLSTTGCLPQPSVGGTPGSPGLSAVFCDFATDVGVANWPNELDELGPASLDVRDGIGEGKEC